MLLVLPLLAAPALPAQVHAPPRAVSCLDTISASALTRVDAFLEADAVPLFGWDVAHQLTAYASVEVMRLLGGSVDSLPRAEPVLGWRDLRGADASVRVTVQRDGRFAWRVPHADSSGAAALLDRALRRVLAGGTVFPLSDGPLDSVAFDLSLSVPEHRRDGHIDSMRVHYAVAVFTIATPWSTPVSAISVIPPRFPQQAMADVVGATVVLKFVVDSTGRVERKTIHDVWPASHSRLAGDRGVYYDDFREAAVRAVRTARFRPARLAGCPVSQRVVMPFIFKMHRP